jgi:hypothetical protein
MRCAALHLPGGRPLGFGDTERPLGLGEARGEAWVRTAKTSLASSVVRLFSVAVRESSERAGEHDETARGRRGRRRLLCFMLGAEAKHESDGEGDRPAIILRMAKAQSSPRDTWRSGIGLFIIQRA